MKSRFLGATIQVAVLTIVGAGYGGEALGQARVVEGEIASTMRAKPLEVLSADELVLRGPKSAILLVAEHIGMVRGVDRSTKDLNRLEYTASGRVLDGGSGRAVSNVKRVVGMDFVLPGVRVDDLTTGNNGSGGRTIGVLAGQETWSESSPGVRAGPFAGNKSALELELWLTPHGAIWNAIAAIDQARIVKVGDRATIEYRHGGNPVRITVGDDMRPERVEVTIGRNKHEATFQDYKDIRGYLVFFPGRITRRLNGKEVCALTTEDVFPNPYLVFPRGQ